MDEYDDVGRWEVDGRGAETGQHEKISNAIRIQAPNTDINWSNLDGNPHLFDKKKEWRHEAFNVAEEDEMHNELLILKNIQFSRFMKNDTKVPEKNDIKT